MSAGALELAPPGHSTHSLSLSRLADALFHLYEATHDIVDLDKTVELRRKWIVTAPSNHPDRLESLSNLAGDLKTRFKEKENLADLDEATTIYHEVVDMCTPGDPDRIYLIVNLVQILESPIRCQKRFKRSGGGYTTSPSYCRPSPGGSQQTRFHAFKSLASDAASIAIDGAS